MRVVLISFFFACAQFVLAQNMEDDIRTFIHDFYPFLVEMKAINNGDKIYILSNEPAIDTIRKPNCSCSVCDENVIWNLPPKGDAYILYLKKKNKKTTFFIYVGFHDGKDIELYGYYILRYKRMKEGKLQLVSKLCHMI